MRNQVTIITVAILGIGVLALAAGPLGAVPQATGGIAVIDNARVFDESNQGRAATQQIQANVEVGGVALSQGDFLGRAKTLHLNPIDEHAQNLAIAIDPVGSLRGDARPKPLGHLHPEQNAVARRQPGLLVLAGNQMNVRDLVNQGLHGPDRPPLARLHRSPTERLLDGKKSSRACRPVQLARSRPARGGRLHAKYAAGHLATHPARTGLHAHFVIKPQHIALGRLGARRLEILGGRLSKAFEHEVEIHLGPHPLFTRLKNDPLDRMAETDFDALDVDGVPGLGGMIGSLRRTIGTASTDHQQEPSQQSQKTVGGRSTFQRRSHDVGEPSFESILDG